MKVIMGMVLSLIVLLVLGRPCFATQCRSDLDCKMDGSEKCSIPAYSSIGSCVKFQMPQKKEAPHPESTPDSTWRRGQFCTTNKDCEPGQSCIKKENAMFGSCL
ncbi:MAG TPA: hypothetical protein DCP92_03510 [Nitrospiraceae bacterium]|jgi:hypothetical protein|nr:hypothetical protein [Nitrospiraceae bacterium]